MSNKINALSNKNTVTFFIQKYPMLNTKRIRYATLLGWSLILLIFTACSSDLQLVKVRNQAGVIIKKYKIDLDQKKQGLFVLYDNEGNKIEEANFKDNLLDGERKLFYENGKIETLENYKSGKFDGVYQTFYQNGLLELEGIYKEDTMEGVWKRYYETGELMEMVTYQNNQENGPFKEFYTSGVLKTEGQYLNGDQEHGLLKLYDETGKIEKKMDCANGICKTVWTKETVKEVKI